MGKLSKIKLPAKSTWDKVKPYIRESPDLNHRIVPTDISLLLTLQQ